MHIPALWLEVLNKVQEVFPQAVIAGGALRDLEYGRPVKDVDIFIVFDRDESLSIEEQEIAVLQAKSQLDDMFDTVTMPNFNKSFSETPPELRNSNRFIESVSNTTIGDTRFEFILAPNNSCDIDSFDFSICQIKFDGVSVTRTEAYTKTLETGEITFNHDYRTPLRAAERIERMKSKFPHMTVLV